MADRMTGQREPAAKVFVSYAYDGDEHAAWVRKLATDLRHNGVDAVLDQWEVRLGDDLTLWMEREIRDSDHVLMVCSPTYSKKANAGEGGVGYERSIVTSELAKRIGGNRLIPLLRRGEASDAIPAFLASRKFADFRDDALYAESFDALCRDLHGVRAEAKPVLGPNPYRRGLAHRSGLRRATVRRGELSRQTEERELNQEIGARDLVIVHISDIHVGSEFEAIEAGERTAEAALVALVSDLDSMGLKRRVDAIVLSGDVASVASTVEFEEARRLLERFTASLELDSRRLFLVPGNHDVNYSASGVGPGSPKSGLLDTYGAFARDFSFYGGPHRPSIWTLDDSSGAPALNVLGFDSAFGWFEEAGERQGAGFVSPEALETARTAVARMGSAPIWAVLHHHVLPTAAIPQLGAPWAGHAMLANAQQFLATCGDLGVELVLHGHGHQPNVSVLERWPSSRTADRTSKKLGVLGAGGIRDHYNVVVRGSEHVTVRSRKRDGAGFGGGQDLVIPVRPREHTIPD